MVPSTINPSISTDGMLTDNVCRLMHNRLLHRRCIRKIDNMNIKIHKRRMLLALTRAANVIIQSRNDEVL